MSHLIIDLYILQWLEISRKFDNHNIHNHDFINCKLVCKQKLQKVHIVRGETLVTVGVGANSILISGNLETSEALSNNMYAGS